MSEGSSVSPAKVIPTQRVRNQPESSIRLELRLSSPIIDAFIIIRTHCINRIAQSDAQIFVKCQDSREVLIALHITQQLV
jgi:hypothetical protein